MSQTNQMERSQYTCQQCRVKFHWNSAQRGGTPCPSSPSADVDFARLIQSFQVDFGSFGDSDIQRDSKR